MRVLLSAYACGPHFGSEPEVGLRAVIAAAEANQVCVLFRADFEEALREAFRAAGVEDLVQLEPLEVGGLPPDLLEPGFPVPSLPSQHLHYERWQRAAALRARELHRIHGFDVVHHVTFSGHWTLVGVASVDAPLVLGPLGGGVEVPLGLVSVLGFRGLTEYALRTTARRVLRFRPRVARPLREAEVLIAQNVETARRLPNSDGAVVLPHATLIDVGETTPPSSRSREVAFCGRLVQWKAGTLAIRTVAELADEATLVVYGDGPDRDRMDRLARRLGVTNRVRFVRQLPRTEMLSRIASSGVLLHPALHDESPLVVSEALSLGTPVVALDHGGARALARAWPGAPACLVAPGTPSSTARRLARAVEGFLRSPAPIPAEPIRPAVSFREVLQDAYQRAVTAS